MIDFEPLKIGSDVNVDIYHNFEPPYRLRFQIRRMGQDVRCCVPGVTWTRLHGWGQLCRNGLLGWIKAFRLSVRTRKKKETNVFTAPCPKTFSFWSVNDFPELLLTSQELFFEHLMVLENEPWELNHIHSLSWVQHPKTGAKRAWQLQETVQWKTWHLYRLWLPSSYFGHSTLRIRWRSWWSPNSTRIKVRG